MIGNTATDRVLKELSGMIPHENDSVLKAFAPNFLALGELLKGMVIVPDSQARFIFRGRKGGQDHFGDFFTDPGNAQPTVVKRA